MGLSRFLKVKHIIIITVLTLCLFLVHIVQAVTAEPGTDADPIVSQSYVDAKVNELNTQVSSLKQQVQNLQVQAAQVFEVVELKKGQQLVAGASTEIILRSGAATAVAGSSGGLSDLTGSGTDLKTGDSIQKNHLIIIPRDDGRGLVVEIDGTFIMVKGTYQIK